MNNGFVIVSQDVSGSNVYQKCSEALAISIKKTMPNAKVSIITTNEIPNKNLFDSIIPLPYGDKDSTGQWKLVNDWQVYEASPYEYTIKLEADLFLPNSLDYWWTVLKTRDLVISTTVRNFKQEISSSRVYRRFIDENRLPDTYNALTYFKKSETAKKFFDCVRNIFENWNEFSKILKCNPDELATTDYVYALAAHIIGYENCILPNFTQMSMIHMKQFVNDLHTEDWTDSLVYEILPETLRINSIPQMYPFHYHKKSFANNLIESYGK